ENLLAAPIPTATSVDILDLQRALLALAPEQREVVLLIALEDMSYADVSRALGIPIGTVMSRLSRGREKLRKLMSGEVSRSGLRVVQ
ncbi:MAG TPA: sigma factor-like helix-turn-helix DNA-binding protein, partial [Usitatibacter sp.]